MPSPLHQFRIASLVVGAVLAVPAAADAAIISPARAEQAAKKAVAPLEAESVACFRATFQQRRSKADRYVCVASVAASPGDTCIVTVTVTAKRPRRVGAKVTIPLRCYATPAPLGSP